jgi:hypothetical protein
MAFLVELSAVRVRGWMCGGGGIAFVEQEMLRLSEAADPCAMPALAAGWHPSRDVLQETACNGF